MSDELFDRYKREREPAALERLVEAHRALIESVCRRYLRHPQDVEDAAQETILKLARHAGEIHGSLGAWLSAAAASSSLDLIRQTLREQRRREQLARITASGPEPRALLHAAIDQRLLPAMAALDERTRHLLVQRFFQKRPLRVLAEEARVSVPTMSRRVSAAVAELARILAEMGVESIDAATLSQHFGHDFGHVDDLTGMDAPESLRFAPDWRAIGSIANVAPPCLPGWTRPVRVGVFVGHATTIAVGHRGEYLNVELQAATTRLLVDPAFQLVGIVEPRSDALGPIERTLRDYELIGGLIDATDAEALATLDVILFGLNWKLAPGVVQSFHAAVRSGVGLLNEWWTLAYDLRGRDTQLEDLLLAGSPIYPYHTEPRCNIPVPATVQRSHVLLPGLKAGDALLVAGCGPLYRPSDNAEVIITKDALIPPDQHRIPGLGPARMPAWLAGELGRGRVIVASTGHHPFLARQLAVRAETYLVDLLAWLAEPKRQ